MLGAWFFWIEAFLIALGTTVLFRRLGRTWIRSVWNGFVMFSGAVVCAFIVGAAIYQFGYTKLEAMSLAFGWPAAVVWPAFCLWRLELIKPD